MNDWIDINKDERHIAKEKRKARELRQTSWWQQQIAEGRCHFCGQSFPPSELTMDHLVPLARGGKSSKGNIVPCCKICNNRKKYLTPAEMILQNLENDNDNEK